MIDIMEIVDEIIPFAPACPEPLIEDAIRAVAEEICRQTKGWVFEDQFKVSQEQDFIAAPYGSFIIKIDRLIIDGKALEATTERQLDLIRPEWRSEAGWPRQFFQRTPGEIRIVPAPDRSFDVSLALRLSTAHDAEVLPDLFKVRWRAALRDGVIARILSLPGKTWSSPDFAAIHNARFVQAVSAARDDVQRGQQSARIRTRASFI